MNVRTLIVLLLTTVLTGGAAAAQAPPAGAPQPGTPREIGPVLIERGVAFDRGGAGEVRQQLTGILRQYPPTLREILQRDPSLLDRPDYLAPYPLLVAFLDEHPDVRRNPAFYFGNYQVFERTPRDRGIDLVQGILVGLGLGTLALSFLGVFVWLVRAGIDHRRWLRQSKVQVEVHNKLVDRLASNEDLLAYMQSPAGSRFLASAPITVDGEPRPGGAPLSRIVWSMQAGIVLMALGLGFWAIQGVVSDTFLGDGADGFKVVGVLILSLGVGFGLSALLAYLVSVRLGLVAAGKP